MENEFIPYEQALALKELGFDEDCFGSFEFKNKASIQLYSDWVPCDWPNFKLYECYAPLYQQLFRWFREKHNMLANVYSNASGWCYEYHDNIGGTHRLDSDFNGPNDSGCWDSYEDARLACIQKLIEIIKSKNSHGRNREK